MIHLVPFTTEDLRDQRDSTNSTEFSLSYLRQLFIGQNNRYREGANLTSIIVACLRRLKIASRHDQIDGAFLMVAIWRHGFEGGGGVGLYL